MITYHRLSWCEDTVVNKIHMAAPQENVAYHNCSRDAYKEVAQMQQVEELLRVNEKEPTAHKQFIFSSVTKTYYKINF